MAARGCICVLIFISAVMVNGRLEKPSLNLIAELLRAPAKEVRSLSYSTAAKLAQSDILSNLLALYLLQIQVLQPVQLPL